MKFVAFLGPSGIDILLAQFMTLLLRLPSFRNFTALDALILLPAVTLARGIHESRVNNTASSGYDVGFFELVGESVKQFSYNSVLGERIAEKPDRLGVRDTVFEVETKETHESDAVVNLELCLLIAEIIDALQNKYLEHEDAVIGRASAGALGFLYEGLG